MKRIAWGIILTACAGTKPGTHVEVVERDGAPTYVAGAAAPGLSHKVACVAAVQRSVAALALRFAQDHEEVGARVAEAVGASDGEAFLQRFAKERAAQAAVQQVAFDPADHTCMATVRWEAPLFVEEAVLAYANALREAELAEPGSSASVSSPPQVRAPASAPAPTAGPAPQRVPPPRVSTPAPPAAPKPAQRCTREESAYARARQSGRAALADRDRCFTKTSHNQTACHRYVLYFEKAVDAEGQAARAWARCLNAGLSSAMASQLEAAAPGHAAVVIEATEAGPLLWAYDVAGQTGVALVLGRDGAASGRAPLDAEQLQWLRGELGL